MVAVQDFYNSQNVPRPRTNNGAMVPMMQPGEKPAMSPTPSIGVPTSTGQKNLGVYQQPVYQQQQAPAAQPAVQQQQPQNLNFGNQYGQMLQQQAQDALAQVLTGFQQNAGGSFPAPENSIIRNWGTGINEVGGAYGGGGGSGMGITRGTPGVGLDSWSGR